MAPRLSSGDSRLRIVSRLVSLMNEAQSGRQLSVSALAKRHGVCKRTISRDLSAIESVLPVRRVA